MARAIHRAPPTPSERLQRERPSRPSLCGFLRPHSRLWCALSVGGASATGAKTRTDRPKANGLTPLTSAISWLPPIPLEQRVPHDDTPSGNSSQSLAGFEHANIAASERSPSQRVNSHASGPFTRYRVSTTRRASAFSRSEHASCDLTRGARATTASF